MMHGSGRLRVGPEMGPFGQGKGRQRMLRCRTRWGEGELERRLFLERVWQGRLEGGHPMGV